MVISKIAHTFPVVVSSSSKLSAQAWPLALCLALGTCTAETETANVKAGFAARSQHLLCLSATHEVQTLSTPHLLLHYCSSTFSCYGDMFMIYNKINYMAVILLHGY